MSLRKASLPLFATAFAASTAHAQTPSASPWPFPSRSAPAATATPSAATSPPPRNPPVIPKTWDQLSNRTVSEIGSKALALKPEQWRHAETQNFVLHFRRVREVNAVAAEIEFDLWFVAQQLGAAPEQYARKSHVYIFKDEAEWQEFLASTTQPAWAHSFAHGDELFLDVHEASGAFDSENVAHETTHAIVARLYGNRRWPVWLSEGFAEYMGRASVAARHAQAVRRNQEVLPAAELTLAELVKISRYPADRAEVHQLYETGEKFVRYLCNRYPKELFAKFVDELLSTRNLKTALIATYGSEFNDMAAFETKFARFTR